MPGYMMHLCEGSYILKKLKNTDFSADNTPITQLLSNGITDASSENEFLLGSVLPDAVSDKSATHFRPAWQDNLITKYPDMSRIINNHPCQSLTIADLGVLAHLHMDSLYVEEFWPKYFNFENSFNENTCVSTDIDHVRMTGLSRQPAGSCIPIDQFFSDKYFYGDYSITNPLFQADFSPTIPVIVPVHLSIIEFSLIQRSKLAGDLSHFINAPGALGHNCNVFSYEDLRNFIIDCANRFFELYTT